ncbi:MAG: acid phosphatase [Thaumarchaeota archaeon]|nr:acid phosphatase [Nitrososphaerota archaeon]
MKRLALSLALALFLAFQPGALSTASASSTATSFKHIVIIMQENHSFDNYFGTYPTANGTLVNNVTSTLKPVNGIPQRACLPYGAGCLSPHPTNSTSPVNPVEGQLTYQNDYGSGFPDNSGPQSMVYFDYRSIPAYWDYAEEYGLADNYYSAVLSMTTPNRLIFLTGDSPVSQNYGPPPSIPYDRTIFSQLDAAGVSWGYYDLLNASQDPAAFYPLNYLAGMSASRADIRNISSLFGELGSGSGLPSVVYVNFLGNLNLTEHPPFSPRAGEARTVSVVNAVMQSSYWDSTAVFVTWDEGGGYYDHVSPPRVFSINHNFTEGLVGLGQRVPLLVISPYSTVNYVSNLQLSHLSLLHFIEYNWGIPPITRIVADSNLPIDFFNFSQSPRPPLLLGTRTNASIAYPVPLQSVPVAQTTGLSGSSGLQYLSAGLALAVVVASSAMVLLYSRSRGRRSGRGQEAYPGGV